MAVIDEKSFLLEDFFVTRMKTSESCWDGIHFHFTFRDHTIVMGHILYAVYVCVTYVRDYILRCLYMCK